LKKCGRIAVQQISARYIVKSFYSEDQFLHILLQSGWQRFYLHGTWPETKQTVLDISCTLSYLSGLSIIREPCPFAYKTWCFCKNNESTVTFISIVLIKYLSINEDSNLIQT